MVKLVLFDLGSTLIYFDAEWPEVLAQAIDMMVNRLSQAGYPLDTTSFAADFHQRIREYYRQRDAEFIEYTTEYVLRSLLVSYGFRHTPTERLRPALDALYAVTQAYWKVEQDAHPTLAQLKSTGYRLGMISNAGDAADVQTLIDTASLRPYFDQILISAAIGIRKPHPRIFELALDFFQVRPSESVMVGDTLGADILGANHIGMRSIWITRRAGTPDNRDHLDTIQPTAAVSTLSEIPALLASW